MRKYPLTFSQGVTVVPNSLLLEVTQGNEAIRLKEQQRIIKLLEEHLVTDELKAELIALIKGERENK